LSDELVRKILETALQYGLRVSVIQLDDFDPGADSSWAKLAPQLEAQFLWLPWNWVRAVPAHDNCVTVKRFRHVKSSELK
jgi:hypothetical protein